MKFEELNLIGKLAHNVQLMGFQDCTPIQEKSIPLILDGKDLAGLAQTGTGKTGAFLIPMVERILRAQEEASHERAFPNWQKRHCILVLVPTRELAEQVKETCDHLVKDTGLSAVSIYGGTGYEKQKSALKNGVEFVIATPGRLIDLYKDNCFDPGQVRGVVFDEADRMFDMGFKEDMKFILRRIPKDRQFLVYSATLNFEVLNTAYQFGAEPVEVSISRDQAKAENVKDLIFHVGQDEKAQFLLAIIKKYQPKQAIVFSNFKHNVERIAIFLSQNGCPALGISSLLSQVQRNRVMDQFKSENKLNILVATDVAARGLDILGVDLVINFDLPDDAENYVHRIGRTGRANQTGLALSLVSDRDVDALQRIEAFTGTKLEVLWLDDTDIVTEFKPMPTTTDFQKPSRFQEKKKPGGGRPSAKEGTQSKGPHHKKKSAEAGGRSKEEHRDRNRGRRADAVGKEASEGREFPKKKNPNPNKKHHSPKKNGASGVQKVSSGSKAPSGSKKQFRFDPNKYGGGSKPTASSDGLGKKVSGFFKKIFG